MANRRRLVFVILVLQYALYCFFRFFFVAERPFHGVSSCCVAVICAPHLSVPSTFAPMAPYALVSLLHLEIVCTLEVDLKLGVDLKPSLRVVLPFRVPA